MSTSKTLGGVAYTLPAIGEDYGASFTNYLNAIADEALTTDGGAKTLLAELDTGANFGHKATYFKGRTTPATAGLFRLGNAEVVSWRDAGNTADLDLTVNASDILEFNGNPLTTLALGAAHYVLTMNAGGTATEYALLDDDNIAAAAGIDATKIADGTVTDAEYQYIGGVTSDVQTQLDAKIDDLTSTTDNALVRTSGTAGEILQDSGILISDSDVVTNMSLDSDNNTITNIVDADIKAAAAIDATKIADGSVSSTEFQYINTLSSNAQTQITARVDLTSAETITGIKSFDTEMQLKEIATPSNPASGYRGLYPKTDGKFYHLDDAGVEQELGGGAGSGEINYIDNGDAEDFNTNGWTGFDDSTVLTDGTGGTATNLTLSSQATTILRGSYSFKLVKAAAVATFEGSANAFTIDKADENKLLKIEFDYNTDGTYTDGDLEVYIYDVTNAALITPSTTSITGWDKDNNGSAKALISFSSTDSNSYRLIFHVADTTSNAWDFYFDNVIVGPGSIVTGATVGPWTSFTPTWTNFTAATTNNGVWRRVGDSAEIKVWAVMSTDNSGSTLEFLMSALGLTIDISKVPSGGSVAGSIEGSGRWYDNSSTISYATQPVSASDGAGIIFSRSGVAADFLDEADLDVNDGVGFSMTAPIAEWAGSGTVNLGANDVEYYSYLDATATTAATTYSDQTKVVRGPAGSQFAAIDSTSAGTTTYSITVPDMQETDVIDLQIKVSGGGWVSAMGHPSLGNLQIQGASTYGISATTTATGIDVAFGNKGRMGNNATYAGNGGAWSSIDASASWLWRVVKHRSGIPVGFGLATADNAGLVSNEEHSAELDLGTITNWATVDSKKYRWSKVGKRVDFWFRCESTTASTSSTSITFNIPAGAPTMSEFSSQGNNEWLASFSSQRATGVGGTGWSADNAGVIYKHTSGQVQISGYHGAAQATKFWAGQFTYYTDD